MAAIMEALTALQIIRTDVEGNAFQAKQRVVMHSKTRSHSTFMALQNDMPSDSLGLPLAKNSKPRQIQGATWVTPTFIAYPKARAAVRENIKNPGPCVPNHTKAAFYWHGALQFAYGKPIPVCQQCVGSAIPYKGPHKYAVPYDEQTMTKRRSARMEQGCALLNEWAKSKLSHADFMKLHDKDWLTMSDKEKIQRLLDVQTINRAQRRYDVAKKVDATITTTAHTGFAKDSLELHRLWLMCGFNLLNDSDGSLEHEEQEQIWTEGTSTERLKTRTKGHSVWAPLRVMLRMNPRLALLDAMERSVQRNYYTIAKSKFELSFNFNPRLPEGCPMVDKGPEWFEVWPTCEVKNCTLKENCDHSLLLGKLYAKGLEKVIKTSKTANEVSKKMGQSDVALWCSLNAGLCTSIVLPKSFEGFGTVPTGEENSLNDKLVNREHGLITGSAQDYDVNPTTTTPHHFVGLPGPPAWLNIAQYLTDEEINKYMAGPDYREENDKRTSTVVNVELDYPTLARHPLHTRVGKRSVWYDADNKLHCGDTTRLWSEEDVARLRTKQGYKDGDGYTIIIDNVPYVFAAEPLVLRGNGKTTVCKHGYELLFADEVTNWDAGELPKKGKEWLVDRYDYSHKTTVRTHDEAPKAVWEHGVLDALREQNNWLEDRDKSCKYQKCLDSKTKREDVHDDCGNVDPRYYALAYDSRCFNSRITMPWKYNKSAYYQVGEEQKKKVKESHPAGNKAFLVSPAPMPDLDVDSTRTFIKCDQVAYARHRSTQGCFLERGQYTDSSPAACFSVLNLGTSPLPSKTGKLYRWKQELSGAFLAFLSYACTGDGAKPAVPKAKQLALCCGISPFTDAGFKSVPWFAVHPMDTKEWTYNDRAEDICLAGRCACTGDVPWDYHTYEERYTAEKGCGDYKVNAFLQRMVKTGEIPTFLSVASTWVARLEKTNAAKAVEFTWSERGANNQHRLRDKKHIKGRTMEEHGKNLSRDQALEHSNVLTRVLVRLLYKAKKTGDTRSVKKYEAELSRQMVMRLICVLAGGTVSPELDEKATQPEDAIGQSITSFSDAFTKTPEVGSGDDWADTWEVLGLERKAQAESEGEEENNE